MEMCSHISPPTQYEYNANILIPLGSAQQLKPYNPNKIWLKAIWKERTKSTVSSLWTRV